MKDDDIRYTPPKFSTTHTAKIIAPRILCTADKCGVVTWVEGVTPGEIITSGGENAVALLALWYATHKEDKS